MNVSCFASALALAVSCCLFSGTTLAQQPDPSCAGKNMAIHGEVKLAYTIEGSAQGDTVVLVPGSGQHAEDWPAGLSEGLVKRGYRVLKLDPRDVGCSTHLDAKGPVDWAGLFAQLGKGEKPFVAYTAQDMAGDVISVLDDAKVERAHIIGASAGATVSGWLASKHPDRVSSLVLLMANSGNPLNPMPADPARMARAGIPPAPNASIEARRTFLAAMNQALEGDEPTRSPEALNAWLDAASARRLDADGLARTGAAMLAMGDLRKQFSSIKAKTLVVHGANDPLVPVAAGKEVADAIPGSQWLLMPKLGHAINAATVEEVLAFIQQQ